MDFGKELGVIAGFVILSYVLGGVAWVASKTYVKWIGEIDGTDWKYWIKTIAVGALLYWLIIVFEPKMITGLIR